MSQLLQKEITGSASVGNLLHWREREQEVQFWSCARKKYPHTIPPTSVESERLITSLSILIIMALVKIKIKRYRKCGFEF